MARKTSHSGTLLAQGAHLRDTNLLLQKKTRSWRDRLLEMLRDALLERVVHQQVGDSAVAQYAAEVAEHKRDPYSLVEELVAGLGRSS